MFQPYWIKWLDLHLTNVFCKRIFGLCIFKKNHPADFAQANAALANQYVNALDATLGYRYGQYEQTKLSQQKNYHPSTEVGYFLPHRKVDAAESVYDKLSAIKWTLIISGEISNQELSRLTKMQLDVLILAKNTYPLKYVLIRPDWHIAYVQDSFIIADIISVRRDHGLG